MPAGDSALYSAKCSESGRRNASTRDAVLAVCVPGIDVDERVLRFRHSQLLVQIVGLERGTDDALAERGDGLGGRGDAGFLAGGEEERTKERTVDAGAEGQLARAHGPCEGGRELRRQLLGGAQQRVPVGDRVHVRADLARPRTPTRARCRAFLPSGASTAPGVRSARDRRRGAPSSRPRARSRTA